MHAYAAAVRTIAHWLQGPVKFTAVGHAGMFSNQMQRRRSRLQQLNLFTNENDRCGLLSEACVWRQSWLDCLARTHYTWSPRHLQSRGLVAKMVDKRSQSFIVTSSTECKGIEPSDHDANTTHRSWTCIETSYSKDLLLCTISSTIRTVQCSPRVLTSTRRKDPDCSGTSRPF